MIVHVCTAARSQFRQNGQSRGRVSCLRRWRSTLETNNAADALAKSKVPRRLVQRVAFEKPMEQHRVYRYLRLESFSDEEFDAAFDRIAQYRLTPSMDAAEASRGSGTTMSSNLPQDFRDEDQEAAVVTHDAMCHFMLQRIHDFEEEYKHDYKIITNQPSTSTVAPDDDDEIDRQRREYATLQALEFMRHFDSSSDSQHHRHVTKTHFRNTLRTMAEAVDYRRTMPITVSMLLVGTSVGVISPVMPFLVESMGLSTGQYGLVVSAFALAKIAGNVPSAVLVERHGRKPYTVHSLSIIAIGTGGIGLASSFEQLYLCRLLVGLGVAALSSASTLSIADLSNPKNRAQTMAPIMSAFAAGTALGPAMGGILADKLGIHATFYVVGASFLGMTVVNQMLLNETKPDAMQFPWQTSLKRDSAATNHSSMWNATKTAVGQWAPLLASQQIRNVVIINGFYWVALAGAQMTLLPLLLTDPNGLAMTATGVGQVYMGMSLVQVLGNPIVAKSVDRLGKVPAILCGCTLISASMAVLPLATDLTAVALTLGLWSTGSTLLSTAPVAYVSDLTDDETRAQAIALMRTSGDVGFLVGASAVGALADWTGGLDVAMQSSAGVLLTATAWYGMRQYKPAGGSTKA
ncbi:sugar transporter [Fragilaria crotonensis]|nr:sugar transporter [Fragilaria crotonensis]